MLCNIILHLIEHIFFFPAIPLGIPIRSATIPPSRQMEWIAGSRPSTPLSSTEKVSSIRGSPLRWRQNGRDSVSNHQPHDCLFNRLFRSRSKKASKLRVTGLCAGNSPGPVNSPHKGPVTRKMFPFDDVIMHSRSLTVVAAAGREACVALDHVLWKKQMFFLYRLKMLT